MDIVRILGGRKLRGDVHISGAKNACLPMLAAALLTAEPCVLRNVPDLADIRSMVEILMRLGAEVEQLEPNVWRIVAAKIASVAPYDLVRKMRASVCLMGPLVGRMRHAQVPLPGGCVIGQRPIDLHVKGLATMGCDVTMSGGNVTIDGAHLRGANVFLGGRFGSTVTGTENIIMTAVLTPGVTRISSAACEPEVVDLCRMLITMGAKIEGIGSHELLIEGVDALHGCDHTVISDRIEAATFILAGLMGENDITIHGANPAHLRAVFHKIEEMGGHLTIEKGDVIRVIGHPEALHSTECATLPYPGYPTDAQAQLCALLSITPGLSIVTERVYPNRFMHVPELQRMGAQIAIEGASAVIVGQKKLTGAPVMASDLRASVALYLAGLVAEGETWVQRVYHLDRGYEKFDEKLRAIGADVVRMKVEDVPAEVGI